LITPQKIQELADPIESVYIHMVDQLLVNIGKHITSPAWTHTASWEIQKLSELGQLTQENAEIINAWIAEMPQEIRDTMEATRAAALDRLEQQLSRAAEDGYIAPAMTDSTEQVLTAYMQQAADRLNLVNTTMLQSSVEQYQRAVALTEQEVSRLEAQKSATQEFLNEAAGNVVSGAETRVQAINRVIRRISDEGLTGFIDRAGRHWAPEAYVNMDIRTTVHNVAIQSIQNRMQDYGTDVFQVSSHAGARPGCYPYQGKFYSWNNSSGSIELGNGSVVDYEPLNSTTYGQAAGLFGINCGHYPIPVIPGVTIPHGADNIQPEEENKKAYAESQEQRALERQIREAKRVVEMAGDTATKEDRAKVRDLQSQMREFVGRTGRTRRYDRESVNVSAQSHSLQRDSTRGIVNKEALHTYHDPMREKMGSAFDSHPHEVEKIIRRLEQAGVEILWQDGNMSYSPSLIPGNPGQMIMDRAASYSAWLHEQKHFDDDARLGYPGFTALIENPRQFAEMEYNAYTVEIEFARANGYEGIAKRLERLRFERRQEILGTQRGNKQAQK